MSADDTDEDGDGDPLIGRVLEDRYRLVGVLGSGGVGVVYRAEHLALDRFVAIKVLLPQYAANAEVRRRFDREAKALAALAHPHIVSVTDYGIALEMPFLVMEHLVGETVDDLLHREGALPFARALDITTQILEALAFTHGQALIHRDLKPGNVFLQTVPGKLDHVRLLDFGLAKFVARDKQSAGPPLTKTGAILGTPAYMAPEQAVGGRTDARTDVYSVGVMLYEMLAGRRPFQNEPVAALLKQLLLEPVPPLRESRPELDASPALERFLQTAMAKERGERFQDATGMLEALRALPPPEERSSTDTRSPDVDPAAGRASKKDKSFVLPTRGAWLMLAAVAATLTILGSVVVIWAVVSVWPGSSTTTTVSPSPRPEPRRVVTAPNDATPAAPQTEIEAHGQDVPPPDPWETTVPPELSRVRELIEGGRVVSPRSDEALRRYGVRQRDPRAFLLLGSVYIRRGWRSDGIDSYRRAHAMDPLSRGDRRMLADLVDLVADDAVSARARDALEAIYGTEATPSVEQVLADPDLNDALRRRYRGLLAALRETPRR